MSDNPHPSSCYLKRGVIGIVAIMTEFKKEFETLIPQLMQKSFDLTIWDNAFLRINEPAIEDI